MQGEKFSQKTDSELLIEMADGDAYAFTILYDRYKRPLYLYAFRKLKDRDLVEDILQEVFSKVWHGRTRMVEVNNFSAYLYRALKNEIIDLFLGQKHAKKYKEFAMIQDARSVGTDHKVRQLSFLNHIFELINDNIPLGKEIFRLRILEDRKSEEVALELGLSEKTVRNRLSLVMKGLRERLPLLPIGLIFTVDVMRLLMMVIISRN